MELNQCTGGLQSSGNLPKRNPRRQGKASTKLWKGWNNAFRRIHDSSVQHSVDGQHPRANEERVNQSFRLLRLPEIRFVDATRREARFMPEMWRTRNRRRTGRR